MGVRGHPPAGVWGFDPHKKRQNPDSGRGPQGHRPSRGIGVSDGFRTRDLLDHNQVLYQLSYAHHLRQPRAITSMS